MEKVGCRVKIYLKNEHGISKTLTCDFKNEIEFKVSIYNCEKNAQKILEKINAHKKINNKWEVLLEEEDLIIFKTEDVHGNKDYLHIDFREEK